MCIRGQLIRDDYSICTGPNIEKCILCNMRYFTSEAQVSSEIRLNYYRH